MTKHPKVSVLCLSYNQKDYIKQCLDSILMQRTDFDIEILINDDASTDGTKEIICVYQKKYPKIIKPIFHSENQYSKGERCFIIRYLLPKVKSEYISICEGDDFWIDPYKLQKQVNFLEKHNEYSICFHPVKVFYENNDYPDYIFPQKRTGFTLSGLLKSNYIQTNSVMYRRQTYKGMKFDVSPADWYLHLYHAQFGKIGFINEVMSAYRRHSGGIWWQTSAVGDVDEIWKKHGVGHMALYVELLRIFGDKKRYRDIIDRHISGTITMLYRIDSISRTNLIQAYVEQYGGGGNALLSLTRSISRNTKTNESTIKSMYQVKTQLEEENSILRMQNAAIVQSSSWKVTKPLRVVKKIITKATRYKHIA